MGVAKKGKRKITLNGRDFYWYVKHNDDDFGLLHLFIVSSDKNFIVSYPLVKRNLENRTPYIRSNPFIVVMGREFKGLDNLGHDWKRFVVPEWNDENVTPSLVALIIDWCFKIERVTPVDWQGNLLESRHTE